MKLTTDQLRIIIKEELSLVLETRAARNWIEKQDESRHAQLTAFYEAGMKNIPDLSYALKMFPPEFEKGIKFIKAFYNPKYKQLLKNYGITQLKHFDEQGYDFAPFMRNLIDYENSKKPDLSKIDWSEDAKIIGQVGDWTITDPVSGKESSRCAQGTTWCTKEDWKYDNYIKGDIKLYYLSNDKKRYPYNKLSFGVDKNGIRYGGDGEYTVDAANYGINSPDTAKRIIGDDFDKIKSILLDYYPKDMENRASKELSTDRMFLNFINFAQMAKSLKDSSHRILFYKRILDHVYKDMDTSDVIYYSKHFYKIFDFVLKDKEMKNKKFFVKEKNEIIDIIEYYYSWPRFMKKMSLEEKIKKFKLIYKSLINSLTRYYDDEGNAVARNEGGNPEINFYDAYSTFKKLYPKDEVPENLLPIFDNLLEKAIKHVEKDIEANYKELEFERNRTLLYDNDRYMEEREEKIENLEEDIEYWEDKLEKLKKELQ